MSTKNDPNRPSCCNVGCYKLCQSSGKLKNRYIYRPYCQHCHLAGMGRHPYREGVYPVKKTYCENVDGRLGFDCYTNGVMLPSAVLDLDHIDGDHLHNIPDNLQTLCKICHALKTKANGDGTRPNKYSSVVPKQQSVNIS